jgi:hypothetical protein
MDNTFLNTKSNNGFVNKFYNFLDKNYEYIKIIYSCDVDIEYASIIDEIRKGKKLIDLQKRLVSFYNIRLSREKTTQMLNIVDTNKNEISNAIDIKSIYKKYYDVFKKITSRDELSFTSKFLNLHNKNIPLYDSRVVNCLKIIDEDTYIENGSTISKIDKYFYLSDIYKNILEYDKLVYILDKLRKSIYKDVSIKHINKIKFIDTLMYSVGSGERINKAKELSDVKENNLEAFLRFSAANRKIVKNYKFNREDCYNE